MKSKVSFPGSLFFEKTRENFKLNLVLQFSSSSRKLSNKHWKIFLTQTWSNGVRDNCIGPETIPNAAAYLYS